MPLYMDRCDLLTLSGSTRGRLGSKNKDSAVPYDENVPCTYVQDNEKVVNNENSDMTLIESSFIIFPRHVVVTEQMIVRNIRDRRGDVVEDGPLTILRLITHRTVGKVVNHRQAYLKKDYSLKEA